MKVLAALSSSSTLGTSVFFIVTSEKHVLLFPAAVLTEIPAIGEIAGYQNHKEFTEEMR